MTSSCWINDICINEVDKHCDVVLTYYWPSDYLSEEGSFASELWFQFCSLRFQLSA